MLKQRAKWTISLFVWVERQIKVFGTNWPGIFELKVISLVFSQLRFRVGGNFLEVDAYLDFWLSDAMSTATMYTHEMCTL